MPAGLRVDRKKIDGELKRRMVGYGRGKRMAIESDRVTILSGLRKGLTIGSPVAMAIDNADHSIDTLPQVAEPRPGHADLAGAMKFNLADMRSVLERASARETAARVSVGALAKILLEEFGIAILSHVTAIGPVESRAWNPGFRRLAAASESSPVRCADPIAAKLMQRAIDKASAAGDTLGGIFEVVIHGAPVGLGSYTQWDKRLDGKLARAVMSIQAVKGVGLGSGFATAALMGSQAHDEIFYDKKSGFFRKTNRAGGIEGGMTNGEDIVIRAAMKPISTLRRPLASVNIRTKRAVKAAVERSDVCAVPAAGVVAENACAIEMANAMIEKFGGDSMREMKRNFSGYIAQLKKF
jgi:chorismate synthase